MYTYDDFKNKYAGAGFSDGQFSQFDMDLAKQNPDAGIGLIEAKKAYLGASTDEQRLLANTDAENIRAQYGGYTGGKNGTQFNYQGLSPSSFKGDSAPSYSFSGETPIYSNKYQSNIDSLTSELLNRGQFSYDKDSDPSYQAYKKQYTRDGQRATADALASASSMSGGMPSSSAVTAGAQAGDYYAAQMSDKIPELYQNAYQRYLSEYDGKRADISTLSGLEQNDYQKYLNEYDQYNTDRNFAYGQYKDKLSQYNTDRDFNYGKLTDQIDYLKNKDDTAYNRSQTAQQNDITQAYQRWQVLGAADERVASVLGVPAGTLYGGENTQYERENDAKQNDTDQAYQRWQVLGKADERVAAALGVPVGSVYGGETAASGGGAASASYMDYKIAANLFAAGDRSTEVIESLENKYGTTIDKIAQAMGVDYSVGESAADTAGIGTQANAGSDTQKKDFLDIAAELRAQGKTSTPVTSSQISLLKINRQLSEMVNSGKSEDDIENYLADLYDSAEITKTQLESLIKKYGLEL